MSSSCAVSCLRSDQRKDLDAPLHLSAIASQQMRQIIDRFGAATLVGAGREKTLLFDVGGVQRYGLCGHIFDSHGNFSEVGCLSR
jgi:hypothetical protein